MTHSHAAVVTERFALTQFGSAQEAVGKTVAISSVPFVIIGVFRERVATFGQSEIADETVLIPYTVARYFTGTDAVNQIYFSMTDSGSVPWATQAILKAIKSRHRSESVYDVGDLSEVLSMAGKTATAFSIVLLLFSLVTLMVSGVGIMNIMLATVRSRIREIGIRKALGATFREIQLQFLAEAVLISLSGGVGGTILAMALPLGIELVHQLPGSGFVDLGGDRHPGLVWGGDCFWDGSGSAGGADGSCRIIEVRVGDGEHFFDVWGIFFIALLASAVYPKRASNTILVLSSFCSRSPHYLQIPRLNSASSRY